MELITVIKTLCILLCIVILPSACESVHGVGSGLATAAVAKLPRKLIPTKHPNVKAYVTEALVPDSNRKAALPGRRQPTHMKLDGRDGTRQKWIEAHMWQYFTMDYHHVRRRRPIHNKSIPLTP